MERTRAEWIGLVANTLHTECGGEDCGAWDFHRENAEAVIDTLAAKGVVFL
jgi:hypothetical protein